MSGSRLGTSGDSFAKTALSRERCLFKTHQNGGPCGQDGMCLACPRGQAGFTLSLILSPAKSFIKYTLSVFYEPCSVMLNSGEQAEVALSLRNLSCPKVEHLSWPRMPLPFSPGWPGCQACVWAGCQDTEQGMEWGSTGLWVWVVAQQAGRPSRQRVSENKGKC